ncbi:MAG: 50S ribosomal protein L25 [Victivallales bacterium]|nr:50S ribosomal protein L25 [Victivallales bacterium]MCF7889097.1 50S ribosomal protein L25 [Victivallales bacterium]
MTTSDLRLNLESRKELGSKESRRLRKAGKIPAVIYGQNKQPRQCTVDSIDWYNIANQDIQILKVFIDKSKRPVNVLIKDIQHDYLSNQTLHVDFKEINMNEEITASVTINVTGTPVGEKSGGVLNQELYELEVSSLPNDLPESIEVDVSELDLDDALYVKDIKLPENVSTDEDPERTVANVSEPRLSVEPEEAEEAEVGEETEAGEEAGEGESSKEKSE